MKRWIVLTTTDVDRRLEIEGVLGRCLVVRFFCDKISTGSEDRGSLGEMSGGPFFCDKNKYW
jgi:hypothetical protein